MELYRLGRYDDGASCEQYLRQARLVLELPAPGDEAKKVEYHNRLMWLG